MLMFKEKGQGIVEYALIVVLVILVVILILSILGTQVGDAYSNVVDSI